MQEVPKLQEPGRGWMELAWSVTGTPAGIAAADTTKATTSNANAVVTKATTGLATAAAG